MASFDDVRKAGDAVAAIIAAGIIPAGLEMMDKPMTAAVEDFVHAGYDLDAAAILLCESDGTPEEVEEEIGRMIEVLRGCGATRHRGRAATRRERLRFWSGRKNAFPASGPHQPRLHVHGLDHPAQAPGRHADRDRARWRTKYGLRCVNVFHAGDGNLHPLILFDANDADQLHRAELFGADILETSVAHGRHRHRRARRRRREAVSMCVQFSPAEREQMFARQARLRPGRPAQPRQGDPHAARAAPSTARCTSSAACCAFPDLPRF